MIDINPKPLENIPVKSIEKLVKEAIHNLDGKVTYIEPKVDWTWDDTGNLVKKLIGNLTLMVYNGKLTLTFWATISVVILFLAFKIAKIF